MHKVAVAVGKGVKSIINYLTTPGDCGLSDQSSSTIMSSESDNNASEIERSQKEEAEAALTQQLSDEVEMMEIAEEFVEDDVGGSGIEVEVPSEMVYEEIIQEDACIEIAPDDGDNINTEIDNDKENTESDIGESEFPEDTEAFMEITRRRISQDREGNCYCARDRNLNIAELLCASCNRWFHESCIGYQLGKLVPFMMNYVFMCKNCSPTGLESFKRSQAQFNQMCLTVLANLTQGSVKDGSNKKTFSKDKEIIPFLEMHWDALTTTTRRVTSSWHSTVSRTLQKDVGVFYTMVEREEEPGCPYFGLLSSDLTIIKPNYEIMIKTGHLKVSELGVQSSAGAAMRGRGGKRRNAIENSGASQGSIAKKTRGDFFVPKMILGHGYPPDHPYNKDNFRYLLAEPDPNAPFRQEFDESSDWAGKPIPGFLYRVLIPCSVLLALHDRAPQLKISEDRLSVTGDKGYSTVRATHGVNRGSWYFEAKIIDLPEGGATRIGFGQAQANLQGPLGYDKFGYSWRSRYGTVFHEARGKSYAKGGYGIGDTLGFLIVLPEQTTERAIIPESLKDKPLVRFKSHLYYEEKDSLAEAAKKDTLKLPIHSESKIYGFKNGVCQGVAFENINVGTYFPAVSLYRNATVRLNFGPEFWSPPSDIEFRGMFDKAEEAIVEQTVSDLMFLTENDGKLSLDGPVPTLS